MKQISLSGFFLLLTFFFLSPFRMQAQVTEKNACPQPPNYDFEVWDNPEPWGWNSSSCFEAGNAASQYKRQQSVWSSTDVRPGSKGTYSGQIRVTESSWYHYKFPFGTRSYEDMGTLTTGVLYYYDDKGNSSSCIYTNTGDGSKSWPFTGRPDSIVFWAKLAENGGRNGDMTLYLHDNSKFEDRANGNTATGTVIGSANVKIQYNGGQWVRYSAPVQYASTADPAYLLLSFTAGNSFREVVEGDQMWVDDVMLIYNPSLSINAEMPTTLVRHGGEPLEFDIPFTITGTMSPFNSLPDNQVIAYLSDAEGSFVNAWELGRLTTDISGSMQVSLPADFLDSDKYRLKLVSTNYPLESQELSLSIYREWYLNVRANNEMGSVEPLGEQQLVRHNSTQRVKATPHPDCAFLGWQENGAILTEDLEYAFQATSDRDLTALFDTTYTLRIENVTGATSYFANNNSQEVTLINGETASLRLTLDYGYEFHGYELNGQVYSEDSPDFDYEARQGGTFYPQVDSIPYEFTFEVLPDAKLGSVDGGGIHKHFSSFTAVAHAANPYSHFLRWEDSLGNLLGTDTLLLFEDIRAGGHYRAVFEEEFHTVSTRPAQGQESWGQLLQNGIAVADSQYSAFDALHLNLTAVPAEGYSFVRFEINRDGIIQSPVYEPSLNLTPEGRLLSDYQITAYFDTARYQVAASAQHGRVVGAGEYKHGQTARLWVVPEEGYHLEAWNEHGESFSTDDTLSFPVLADRTLEAVMALNTYAVSIESRPEGWGSVTPASGLYMHFEKMDLQAYPAAQRDFLYWVINEDTVSSSASYSYEVKGEVQIVAVFDLAHYQVDAISSDPMRGDVAGGGEYIVGQTPELTATAFEGYHFEYWADTEGRRFNDNPLRIEELVSDTTFTAYFAPNLHTLRLGIEGPGEVRDAQDTEISEVELAFGSVIELNALATDKDYEFEAWKNEAGEVASTDNPLALRIISDTSLTASFGLKKWELNLSVSPAGAGMLEGGGTYAQGERVRIKAEPMPGYRFSGWYEGSELLSTDGEYSIDITEDRFIVARFESETYTVEISVEPEGAALSFGGQGEFRTAYNTLLRVEPATGYELAAWISQEGDTLSLANPYLHEVHGDLQLTALMQAQRLRVDFDVEPALAGSVEMEEGIYGETNRATAIPGYGYEFGAWVDAEGNEISQNPVLEFSSTTDTNFGVRFDRAEFDIILKETEGGRVSGAGIYPYMSQAELKAEPEEHYRFAGWFDQEGNCLSMQPEWRFDMRADMEIEPRFEPVDVQAAVAVSPQGAGLVLEKGKNLPSVYTAAYGSRHDFTASASPAWHLAGWRIEKEGNTEDFQSDTLTWTLQGGEILTALFDTNSYSVNVEAEGLPENAGWKLEGAGEYAHGRMACLRVEEPEHYVFAGYYDEAGRLLSESKEYLFSVKTPMNLTARFASKAYRLDVIAAGNGQGSVCGTGLYPFDSSVEVSAFPYEGQYEFSHWSSSAKGSDTLSKTAVWTVSVEGSDSLYAFFRPASRLLELLVAEGEGSVQGAGSYNAGSEARIEAQAAEGYHFAAWMENGNLIGRQAAMDWTMDKDYRIGAVFEPDTFLLDLALAWEGEGSASSGLLLQGGGEYAYGSEVPVLLSGLGAEMEFLSWVDAEGEMVSGKADFVYELRQDSRLEARLRMRECQIEVLSEGEGEVSGGGTYTYGDTALLVASAAEGMRLQAWKLGDALMEAQDTLRLPVRQSLTCTAVFESDELLVQAWPNLSEGGSVSGGRMAVAGEPVTLTAEPEEGYRFLYWTRGDSLLSEEAVLTMEAAGIPDLVAHFEAEALYVRLQASLPEGVSAIEGAGSYRKGEEAELGISLREGYRFEGWYLLDGNGEERLSDQESCIFTVEGTVRIEARVAKNQ